MTEDQLPEEQLNRTIDLALEEDTGHGDITSEILIPPNLEGKASMLVKEAGVLAGVGVAMAVFRRVDASLNTAILVPDGTKVKPGDVVATISGRVASILKAERTAVNFIQRLSGIAALTSRYVAEIAGTRATIVDTRKTTPGLRFLEKYAVRMGGGKNHRMHLGDAVLIKDNHLAALRTLGKGLREIVVTAKARAPQGIIVEVEVTSLEQALEAAEAGADMIMLDNMAPEAMTKVVARLGGRVKIEASGGINLGNVRAAAEAGVDIISIGALTHSPKALDISLELEPQTFKLF